MNCYVFTMVSREDGLSSRDDGLTIEVYTDDMVTAKEKAQYQNRMNEWNSVPKIVDVKLDVEAPNEMGPSVWYNNAKVGLAVRIQ
jgi:hypothetical protein